MLPWHSPLFRCAYQSMSLGLSLGLRRSLVTAADSSMAYVLSWKTQMLTRWYQFVNKEGPTVETSKKDWATVLEHVNIEFGELYKEFAWRLWSAVKAPLRVTNLCWILGGTWEDSLQALSDTWLVWSRRPDQLGGIWGLSTSSYIVTSTSCACSGCYSGRGVLPRDSGLVISTFPSLNPT